jgi:ATP-dependent Clp protease ATP-binding subunit ClpA
VYERLTDQSRAVIANAQEAARAYNHRYVGTEHILLALLKTPCAAAQVLRSFGIGADQVDARVMSMIGMGDASEATASAALDPRGQSVIERSHREADSLGHQHVDSEHILLGLLGESDGKGAQILAESGAEPKAIRGELLRRLAGGHPAPSLDIDGSVSVTASPAVRSLLMSAAARALDDGRTEIELHDVVLALGGDQTAAPEPPAGALSPSTSPLSRPRTSGRSAGA